jgi:hypothetical protein
MKNKTFSLLLKNWKIGTLIAGLAALIFGSFYEQLPDWDIGISLIMGILTYLTAPLCIKWIYTRNYKMLPVGALLAWFTIDASYCLYNAALGHPYFRDANWPASTSLYFLMGFFWSMDLILKVSYARTASSAAN